MAKELFELRLDVMRGSAASLTTALYRQLRDSITDGRLAPGTRLPSTRSLAARLGVSRNTAAAAYDLLLSEGYAASRKGSGTFVANWPSRRTAPRSDASMLHKVAAPWRDAALPLPWQGPMRYDFRPGFPDQRLFPFDVWRRHVARALRAQARRTGAAGSPQGSEELRAAIALHVSATRAVSCTADQVIVTAGAQQAFDILARVLVVSRRTRIAFENPGYTPLRAPFAAAGARIVDVPVDAEGLRVDLLPAGTDVVCVAPSHQFPYGVTMSAARRAQLLEFARRHDALVIEDDYDAEFRLTGQPLDALQTLDREGRVLYVGTFSKSFFPAIRTGYLVVPAWARAPVVAAKLAHNWHAPSAPQVAIATFIREGELARHVRRMRRVYAERHAALFAALERHLPDVVRPWPALAGLHVCGAVQGVDAQAWARAAQEHHIRIESLARYSSGRHIPHGLIFGLGLLGAQQVDAAVQALAAARPAVRGRR